MLTGKEKSLWTFKVIWVRYNRGDPLKVLATDRKEKNPAEPWQGNSSETGLDIKMSIAKMLAKISQ